MIPLPVWSSCPRCARLWDSAVVEGATARVKCGCGTEFVVPQQHSGARAALSTGDKFRSRVAAGDAAVAALAEIKELHAPTPMCASCGDVYRPHEGGTACRDGGPLRTLCSLCCFGLHDRTRACETYHDHSGGWQCQTTAIIARAER